MTESQEKRTLTIHIQGDVAHKGNVPLNLLTDKLQAIQRALFNVGTAIISGGTRGSYKTEVLESCSLNLVSTSPTGSLQIVTEVPPGPKDLFAIDGNNNLGTDSLKYLSETVDAIATGNRDSVKKIYPDRGHRARILRSIRNILPEEDSDYAVELKTNYGSNKLEPSTRDSFDRVAVRDFTYDFEEETQTITGKLYLIEVDTGKQHIGVVYKNRNIECYYPPEFEGVIKDLVPGALVEVEGRAILTDQGAIKHIEEIFDARNVQLLPLYWSKLTFGNYRYNLKQRICIKVDFRDGLWIHENDHLGIIGYGTSRAESLESFRMEFAACWDEYANEDDKNLTIDAQRLKKQLKELIEEPEELI